MAPVIRRSTPHDAAQVAQLMSDPAVFGGLMQLPYPSEAMWQARLATDPAKNPMDLSLVAEHGGRIVGSAGLVSPGTAPRRRHVMGLGISVAREAQRQGVGTALMAALCDYADRWIGVLRIELTVFADNEVAQRLYRRFGFETEGLFKGYALRDGVFVDVLAMARLHPAPPAIAPFEAR